MEDWKKRRKKKKRKENNNIKREKKTKMALWKRIEFVVIVSSSAFATQSLRVRLSLSLRERVLRGKQHNSRRRHTAERVPLFRLTGITALEQHDIRISYSTLARSDSHARTRSLARLLGYHLSRASTCDHRTVAPAREPFRAFRSENIGREYREEEHFLW